MRLAWRMKSLLVITFLTSAFDITEGLVRDPLVHVSGGEIGSESEDFSNDDYDVDHVDDCDVEPLDCDFHDDVWRKGKESLMMEIRLALIEYGSHE